MRKETHWKDWLLLVSELFAERYWVEASWPFSHCLACKLFPKGWYRGISRSTPDLRRKQRRWTPKSLAYGRGRGQERVHDLVCMSYIAYYRQPLLLEPLCNQWNWRNDSTTRVSHAPRSLFWAPNIGCVLNWTGCQPLFQENSFRKQQMLWLQLLIGCALFSDRYGCVKIVLTSLLEGLVRCRHPQHARPLFPHRRRETSCFATPSCSPLRHWLQRTKHHAQAFWESCLILCVGKQNKVQIRRSMNGRTGWRVVGRMRRIVDGQRQIGKRTNKQPILTLRQWWPLFLQNSPKCFSQQKLLSVWNYGSLTESEVEIERVSILHHGGVAYLVVHVAAVTRQRKAHAVRLSVAPVPAVHCVKTCGVCQHIEKKTNKRRSSSNEWTNRWWAPSLTWQRHTQVIALLLVSDRHGPSQTTRPDFGPVLFHCHNVRVVSQSMFREQVVSNCAHFGPSLIVSFTHYLA